MPSIMHTVVVFVTFVHACTGVINKWDVFSTKTAYVWAHDRPNATADEDNYRNVDKICSAVHIGMLLRHGARYPSESATQDIVDLRSKLLEFKTGPMFNDINQWSAPGSAALASQLATEGEQEQQNIARRTAIRFRTLLTTNGRHVKFVSSSKQRCIDSSKHFHIGLQASIPIVPAFDNQENNTLTRFDDDCLLFETEVDDNVQHLKEFFAYSDTTDFKNINVNLQRRLGLNSTLTQDEVYLLYEVCAYDKYLRDTTSFWCDLLTDQERLILEYGQDIEKYYMSSYGHPINSVKACPLISDLFHTMDAAINDTWNYDNLPAEAASMGYLAGKFVFGHSDSVVAVTSSLGLYKDALPPKANNRAAMANRKFKTSTILPFSSSVAFVLYVCADSSHSVSNADRSFMLQVYVNEQAVRLPGCDKDMCPYSQVRQHYKDLIENCNRDKICNPKTGDTSIAKSVNTNMALVLVAVVLACLKIQ